MSSYHSEVDSLSTTQFKLFLESPKEYWATFVDGSIAKKQSTMQMNFGKVCHAMLLEKVSIDDIVRAYPTTCLNRNGGLKGAAAQAFAAKIYPIIPLKDDEIEQIEAICESVRKSELGEILKSNAQFEQRIDSTVCGVKTRCKPDIHAIADDTVVIWDLKFTQRIRPEDFWRTAKQMGYHIQDAFYSLTAESHYGLPATFRFWAVETGGLMRVKPYSYDERSREISKEYVRVKLGEYAMRKEMNDWEDKWVVDGGVIGPWDVGGDDSNELIEFDE